MNTYVFNMGGPVGTVEFYEDYLKSIIWEKDEDDCWVSYDPIPCVSEPEDPEVYVYDFRVCGDDLFVGGAYVKSIYSTNGKWKRIEDWKKLLDVPEDMEESFRPRGRMLRETYDIEDYPHVYIGRTDEYYNNEDEDDSVLGSYEWWTWSEDANDSDFANEGPVFELTEDGKEDFFVWLDAEQVGYNLGNGRMKDWPKKHLSPEDEWEYLTSTKNGLSKKLSVNESRRSSGQMLKEYKDEMPIPYLIGQVKFEDGWSPMVVYLNWGDDRYWYEASIIEAGGVMFEELGRGFVVSKVKPGTDKCDPKEVYAVKRHFFDSCEDQGLPVREVKTVRELGRCAPAGRELHSRD